MKINEQDEQRQRQLASLSDGSGGCALFNEADILHHPNYNASFDEFYSIARDMVKLGNTYGTFHTYVHIIPIILRLAEAKTFLEVGSFCGASMAHALSVPSLRRAVSVDMEIRGFRGTGQVFRQNMEKYKKVFNSEAEVIQVSGNSRDHTVKQQVFHQFPNASVDVYFIDGDHFDPLPDYYIYKHLVRPGGFIVWDDFKNHRVVGPSLKRLALDEEHLKCYHNIGSIKNFARAANLVKVGETAFGLPYSHSNEFIMQKKCDCKE